MKTFKTYILIILLSALSCVDPYEIKNIKATSTLVVEGVISNQLKRHQIFLTRTTALTDKQLVREQGATVTISDSNGNTILLSEESPGIYETPEFSAQAGSMYTLHIKTADGSEYASQQVPFKDGPDIGDVYAKYVYNDDADEKGIQVYVDTEDPTNKTHYYRWSYVETYEVHAPFPSIWIWVGNNSVEPRWDGIDTCYAVDTLRNVLIRNTLDLEQDKVTGQKLRFIPGYSHILRHRYTILVQQFALSAESYMYWENLRKMSEEQGSLSDTQPGSLQGNIVSLTNTNETVLGYFDAGRVSEKRIWFSAINFYADGLKNPAPFRSNCYDIQPIFVPKAELDAYMKKFERTMHIWDAIGMEPNTIFELMPKSCCDCRDQGPTERPDYF